MNASNLTLILVLITPACFGQRYFGDCCDKYSKIKVIKELLDDGALTQAEFDSEKAKILNGDAPHPIKAGELESNAIYGLDMPGWKWDHFPTPAIPESEPPGRIVFTIEVNEHGELIRYRKESGTVSAAAERAFVEAIQKLTFTKTPGTQVPPISMGRIEFVITTK